MHEMAFDRFYLCFKSTGTSKPVVPTDVGVVLTAVIGLHFDVHLVERSIKVNL